MSVLDWDKLSETAKVAFTKARKRSGYTSVFEQQKLIKEDARAAALGEPCDWLAAHGYGDASAALEAAAFEVLA